jgi:uncharacterized protein (TIGR02246 family)
MAQRRIENELLDLERQYWQAIKDKDAETAMRLSDDPCIITGAQGVSSVRREQFRSIIDSADYTLNNFELSEDAQVRFLGDDVAVLAYQVKEELTVDGEPVTFEAADASTWVRRNGRWLCALHTESITGDPFGRDRTTH